MVGGRAAGMVITSALLGMIVQNFSWSAGFTFLAIVTLLPLPLVLKAREAEKEAASRFEWSAFKSFTRSHVIALGTLGALYSLIINGANQLVNPFLVERFQISISTAGYIATVVGLGTILGGLVGGNITDRIGQKRSVQTAMIVTIIGVGLIPAISATWMAWVLVFIFGFAFGFYETVYFAISMRVTDGRIAATMFSILMAVANIGTGIGLGLTGFLADSVGFVGTFILIAVINLTALPLIRVIFAGKQAMEKVG